MHLSTKVRLMQMERALDYLVNPPPGVTPINGPHLSRLVAEAVLEVVRTLVDDAEEEGENDGGTRIGYRDK